MQGFVNLIDCGPHGYTRFILPVFLVEFVHDFHGGVVFIVLNLFFVFFLDAFDINFSAFRKFWPALSIVSFAIFGFLDFSVGFIVFLLRMLELTFAEHSVVVVAAFLPLVRALLPFLAGILLPLVLHLAVFSITMIMMAFISMRSFPMLSLGIDKLPPIRNLHNPHLRHGQQTINDNFGIGPPLHNLFHNPQNSHDCNFL
mmetsp:Transcript_12696/g.18517  ORF Transcript_12696/g.18517 Transcript_12696/m.18517 type:complete len:200 (-) Transcript_12696:626-1225(-)